jgi:Sulfotransferase family
MIISHKHKFIFVHVPKTGGTSITYSFLKHLDKKNDTILGCLPPYDKISRENKIKGGLHKHSSASDVKKELGNIYSNYFSFAFVRNPYDLILSQYYWWKATNIEWDKAASKVKAFVISSTFDEFVIRGKGYKRRRQFPFLYNEKITNELMAISNDVLRNRMSIETAKDYIKEYKQAPVLVNQLYRMEHFSDAIIDIGSRIGVNLNSKHMNKSSNLRPQNDYSSIYLSESKTIIDKFALVDLILFDYTF